MAPNPEVSPMMRGYLQFNSHSLFSKSLTELYWNSVQPWQHFARSPAIGINVYSWALDPLNSQGTGTANLSRIEDFRGIYDMNPLISNANPAVMTNYVMNCNIWRVMSGLCGLGFEN
jgi:hypothetical protein